MAKLIYPSWFKSTLHSNFDNAPNIVNTDKIIGFCPTLSTISLSDTKLKGVSHFYTRNNILPDEKFETILGSDYGFSFFTTTVEAYLNGVNRTSGFSKKSVITDQLVEGSGLIPMTNYWSRATAFYKGLTEALSSNSKQDNNIFGSYVTEFNNTKGSKKFNLSFGGYTYTPTHQYFKDFLSSESEAQKTIIISDSGISKETFPFFIPQGNFPAMSTFMNLLTMGYIGMNEATDDLIEYDIFYEVQKKLAANVDTIIFHWIGSESVTLNTDQQSANTGWIIPRDDIESGAYFKFKDTSMSIPYKTMFLAFFGFLLGKGIVNWDSVREDYSKNPQDLKNDEYLNELGYVTWNSTNGLPQPQFNQGINDYPTRPHSIQDLYLIAYDWYKQVKNKMDSENIELKYLDYNDGVSINTVDTSMTDDKRIFTQTIKPYGQHNILYLADQKKPLVIGGGNSNSHIVIYYDPFGNPSQKKNLSVDLGNGYVNIGNVLSRNLEIFIK